MTTDQEIKDRLFRLWAENITIRLLVDVNALIFKDQYSDKTIHEIKALMLKDDIKLAEINKIIGV